MSGDDNKGSAPFLEHASKGMLTFCGSLVALSIALTVIGFDAKPLIDAWSQSIIIGMETECSAPPEDILERIKQLELLAHKPT